MKKTLLIRIKMIVAITALFAANGYSQNWTWVSGDSTWFPDGVFTDYWDDQYVPTPSSRYGSSTWIDGEGNLWLFGGYGIDVQGTTGHLGDLWQYVVATNRWKLVGGTPYCNQPSNYGIQGVASLSNRPSGRFNCLTWTDHNGKFWIYGGIESLEGQTLLGAGTADLWKYDPVTGLWTFVNGRKEYITTPPNLHQCFGTQGVESATNDPLTRAAQNNPTWTDGEGNLWFYDFSQLWKYNLTTNRWTWMSGGSVVNNVFSRNPRIYGSKGVQDPLNHPGDRNYPTTFTDKNGDLWLYGGHYSGYQSNLDDWGFLNDLWKYSTESNEWTWIHGDSVPDQMAVFGTQGVSSGLTTPGARGAAAGWVDEDGTFWLFGGRLWLKKDENTTAYYRNDLWHYQPDMNEWTWIKEPGTFSDQGVYIEQLVPSDEKRPHSRYNAMKWVNNQGLWLFGGNGSSSGLGSFNDLWCFGCDTLKQLSVSTNFEMPNIFSPDNDGVNDSFHPSIAYGYQVRQLYIVNRWGEQVFESTSEKMNWDGNVNGKPASEGIYYWTIEVEDVTGKRLKQSGSLTLVRGQ